ncbi:MAG: cysteine desulfurase [Pseudobdellovibrionaceae bacterium]|nr:cysteine desulfurase [Bdellovibrionales bacterium]USN48359.1 MAG: cysteine desulfurase [Pseudobdellovibrionaceae bacterium]
MTTPIKLLSEPQRVYLDHNATTPLAHGIVDAMPQWLEKWGNPSSIHWSGREPKALLRNSRQAVAQFVGANSLEIVFTSGGSEANNMALKGVFFPILQKMLSGETPPRRELVISAVEHPSIVKAAESLQEWGIVVHRVPVSRNGELDFEFLTSVVNEKTALVSVMYANNETGHCFPIAKISKLVREQAGALFHCDGVQALGKAAVDVKRWGVDMASFSGHKFYALKGCGFLYIRKGLNLPSLIHGGGQERRRRAGTENTVAIASLGYVVEHWGSHVSSQRERLAALRDQMEDSILESISDVTVAGREGKRMGNTSSLMIAGVDGESLLMNLDILGFSVSTGAACSSGNPEPSPVLLAMGLSRDEAQSSLRLSLGWGTTEGEIKRFVEALVSVVERLRSFVGGTEESSNG